MPSLLVAHELRKSYVAGHGRCWARVQVLAGASLVVAPGERVLVTGGAGAGKTTLLHCLTGLRRPDAGTVRWVSRRHAPYRVCAHPAQVAECQALAIAELPAAGPELAAWLEALSAGPATTAGWLVFARRGGALAGLAHRTLVLRDGVLRQPARGPARRVAEGRARQPPICPARLYPPPRGS